MAIYSLNDPGDRIAGSRSGATFQKAGIQFIIRSRIVPKQKRTLRQSQVKNRFDHVKKFWRTLDTTKQQTFEDEAVNYPRVNSLGDTYYLRGDNLQASSNLNLLATGSPTIDEMPAPASFPSFTITSAQIFVTGLDALFAISENPTPSGFALRFFMSAPYATQEERPTLPLWQIAEFNEGDDQTNFNWWPRFIDLFGNRPEYVGQFFFVSCHLVSLDTGQTSPAVSSIGIITV